MKYKIRETHSIGNFKVFIVDGAAIRKEVEKDFTNFAEHFRFSKLIPKMEFWIDEGQSQKEIPFFLSHMLIEWKLMSEGKSYKVALEAADKKEKQERKDAIRSKRPRKKILKSGGVELKSLGKDEYGIEIFLVNGEKVRTLFDIDFVEGGHDLVYDFIPPKRIWIDNDMVVKERAPTILHESSERNSMSHGMSYENAHHIALQVEWKWRHEKH